MSIGLSDYILKPIPNRKLTRTINKWLLKEQNQQIKESFSEEEIKEILKDKKALVADDQMVNLMTLVASLKKYDMQITKVNDGDKLVEEYQKQFADNDKTNHFDVIITDINMPSLDGNEATKQIRDLEIINDIRNPAIIIANSGDSDPELIHKLLLSGMEDVHIKASSQSLPQSLAFWLSIHSDTTNYHNKTQIQIERESKINPDQTEENDKNYQNYKLIGNKFTKEELKEYEEIFITSSQELLQNIQKASNQKDTKQLAFETHALKGIAGNLGAQRLYAITTNINEKFKKDQWPENKDWLKDLEKILDDTIKDLKK
jgi:CheY-like chemotaxis protein